MQDEGETEFDFADYKWPFDTLCSGVAKLNDMVLTKIPQRLENMSLSTHCDKAIMTSNRGTDSTQFLLKNSMSY